MSAIASLTPFMTCYNEEFNESGDIRWLPYLMFFNPCNLRTSAVNTDAMGFRYSNLRGDRYSVSEPVSGQRYRLLAGNSMVFGTGATSDDRTLNCRMSLADSRGSPWLNFGGVAFNSAQELLLFTLYRHLLPPIDEIVLISGFNNLGLSHMPEKLRGDQGAIFSCNQFYESMHRGNESGFLSIASRMLGFKKRVKFTAETPSMNDEVTSFKELPSVEKQIDFASRITLQHLRIWKALADDMNAKFTFMLQPMATWVRSDPCEQEKLLFAELDEAGKFSESYGAILDKSIGAEYSRKLLTGAEELNIPFVDLNPLLSSKLHPKQWAYVDRIHMTDTGYDTLSTIVLDSIR